MYELMSELKTLGYSVQRNNIKPIFNMSLRPLLSNEHSVRIVPQRANERERENKSLSQSVCSRRNQSAPEEARLLSTSARTHTVTHGYSQCDNAAWQLIGRCSPSGHDMTLTPGLQCRDPGSTERMVCPHTPEDGMSPHTWGRYVPTHLRTELTNVLKAEWRLEFEEF